MLSRASGAAVGLSEPRKRIGATRTELAQVFDDGAVPLGLVEGDQGPVAA